MVGYKSQKDQQTSERISNGLKASAKSRQCPKCKRKAALKKRREPEVGVFSWCRYCDFAKELRLGELAPDDPLRMWITD